MAHEHVLVVEDEREIQDLICYNLAKDGYRVSRAASGEEALRKARSEPPQIVVLDLMLPGMDGLEVCRTLKTEPGLRDVPVVILTAKGDEADVVAGLELGADDYVTKPFSPRVLVARIRAVLRRAAAPHHDETTVLRIHNLAIDPRRFEALVDGRPVPLSPTEFRVLRFLAKRPGWVFTRGQIADAVHGGEGVVTDRSIDVQIVALRKKLGSAGSYIETVRGVGYRFRD
jgi:two-component system phosphate regulon response regulator PhoB